MAKGETGKIFPTFFDEAHIKNLLKTRSDFPKNHDPELIQALLDLMASQKNRLHSHLFAALVNGPDSFLLNF